MESGVRAQLRLPGVGRGHARCVMSTRARVRSFPVEDSRVAARVRWSTGVAHLLIDYPLCERPGRSAIPTCWRGGMITQGLYCPSLWRQEPRESRHVASETLHQQGVHTHGYYG
jgi:hypothetical protein